MGLVAPRAEFPKKFKPASATTMKNTAYIPDLVIGMAGTLVSNVLSGVVISGSPPQASRWTMARPPKLLFGLKC